MPLDSAMAYLIINNSFILAGAIIAMVKNSTCSRFFLCGSCFEIDNLSHQETVSHQPTTTDIITAQSQIVQPQQIQLAHMQ